VAPRRCSSRMIWTMSRGSFVGRPLDVLRARYLGESSSQMQLEARTDVLSCSIGTKANIDVGTPSPRWEAPHGSGLHGRLPCVALRSRSRSPLQQPYAVLLQPAIDNDRHVVQGVRRTRIGPRLWQQGCCFESSRPNHQHHHRVPHFVPQLVAAPDSSRRHLLTRWAES
jgi:hypothetical protein